MKTPNDLIGNRTRDLPACSAVPQPTAPPHAVTGFRFVSFTFYCNGYFAVVSVLCTECLGGLLTMLRLYYEF
jgi:hypothetical protein